MTPQEQKVMELALEALGTMDVFNPNRMEAITALRQAIAEAEKQDKFCDNNCVWTDHHPDCKLSQQEPEWYHVIDVHGCNRFYHKTEDCPYEFKTPLCIVPPQRKPLTHEQIDKAWRSVDYTASWEQHRIDIARAIEAAHGIKGEA